MHWLTDYSLDLWTIAVGIVTNAACAIVGCFLVLRRMSLLGDAISHSIIAGIALAYLATGTTAIGPLLVGALAVGLLTAVLTQSLADLGRVPEDSSMGIVFTSLFALGAIIVSQVRIHLDTRCVLEGSLGFVVIDTVPMLGLEVPRVLTVLVPVLAVVVAFTVILWKELKIGSFDPMLATTMGLSALAIHYVLMAMVALVTVASLEAIGAILAVAMLIVPGATAHLLTDRMGTMVFSAVGVGVVAAVGGGLAARWLNVNAAGAMAVVAGLEFGVAVLAAPRHGLLVRLLQTWQLSQRIASEDLIALLFRHEERLATEGADVELPTKRECLRHIGGGWRGALVFLALQRRDLVEFAPHGRVQLTRKGRLLGQSLVRSHRLWEAYLDHHFDLPPDHLHAPAERIEHFIGPELQDRLARELDRPELDPHGSAIPPSGAG